jgi:hypothetical protein
MTEEEKETLRESIHAIAEVCRKYRKKRADEPENIGSTLKKGWLWEVLEQNTAAVKADEVIKQFGGPVGFLTMLDENFISPPGPKINAEQAFSERLEARMV